MPDKGEQDQVVGEDGGVGGKEGGGDGPLTGAPAEIQPLALPPSADALAGGSAAAVIQMLQVELGRERDRAQRAEAEAAQAKALLATAQAEAGESARRLAEAEASLAQAREALDAAERRHQIDLLLIESEAIDLEAARLLTELSVSQMESKDAASAVADLKRRKPYLFRRMATRTPAGAAMSAAAGEGWPLEEAAAAARSGDRGALLRYLRARRGVMG